MIDQGVTAPSSAIELAIGEHERLIENTAAIDLLGLSGVLAELVDKCYRDVKIFEGTGEVQRIAVARRLLDYPPA